MCPELLNLGMTLARAAATRAAADIATPTPTLRIPCSAAAALEQAEHAARHRAPDYGRLFTHLIRAIRQTMLLEAHITEGPARARHCAIPHAPANDTPTRDFNREAPSRETPRHDMPRRETLERLDCTLPITPSSEGQVEHRLQTTGQALAATPNANTPPIQPIPPPHTNPPRPTRPKNLPATPADDANSSTPTP